MSDIVYIRQKYKEITGNANADDVPIYAMKQVVKAYDKGRADGYSQAENDYFAQSQKDREDTYNCGYAIGKADKLAQVKEILSAMVIHEVIDNFAYEQIMVQIGADE